MNSWEYIKVAEVFNNSPIKFSTEELYIIDEVRKLHKKYQSELEDWLVYPNKLLTRGNKKMQALAKDIKDFCEDNGVKAIFENLKDMDWSTFRRRFADTKDFVQYHFKGANITSAVAIIKPEKQIDVDLRPDVNLSSEEIGELEL